MSRTWDKAPVRLVLLAACVFLLSVAAASLQAATIVVSNTNDDGPGSLRAALASAADGDTIDSTGISGTILLTSGELVVDKSVTILGPGPDALAVNGNAAGRVFCITNAVTATISSLTITNGRASVGGGIHNRLATLTVSNLTVSGNSANGGGGINNSGRGGRATLTVLASAVTGNSAKASHGGGILNDGDSGSATLTVSACTVSGNSAEVGGGGIFNDGSRRGRAMLTVHTSTFSGNSAKSAGGGIMNGGYNGTVTLQVSACTLSDNWAKFGGGIHNDGPRRGNATLTVHTSTLTDNSASKGGGIFNRGFAGKAMLTVSACTFSGNSADEGCSIYSDGYSGTSIVEIGDTILRTGLPEANIECSYGRFTTVCYGTKITSRGYNLSSDSARGFLTAKTDRINTDPMLGPLQDNGGPTFTHALLPGSPAINRGKRDVIPSLVLDTDQRGFSRPVGNPAVGGGDGSDIGAFEVQLSSYNEPNIKSQEVLP